MWPDEISPHGFSNYTFRPRLHPGYPCVLNTVLNLVEYLQLDHGAKQQVM